MEKAPMSAHKKWLYAAAGLSALAGFIHVLAAPEHFEEWIGYGMFFFAAAAAQILFALMLAAYADNPHRDLLIAGIAGNAAIILLWLITRTLGIPFFGPEAGEVEPLGVLDSLSKITELALIACLAVLLRRRPVPASK
jgi:hypothetical protein